LTKGIFKELEPDKIPWPGPRAASSMLEETAASKIELGSEYDL